MRWPGGGTISMAFPRVERQNQDDTEYLQARIDVLLELVAKLGSRLEELVPNDPLLQKIDTGDLEKARHS